MNRNVKIKQHDYTDCGATCIVSIAAFYNKKLPLSKIRQMTSTDKQGANVYELPYKNGQMDGVAKEYYPSGKIKIEEPYKNGQIDGVAKAYDESGKVIQ